LLLLALSALAVFFKLRYKHPAYWYTSYIVCCYRDFSYFLLLAIYLIEHSLNFSSYSLLVLPFFLTPLATYALEGLLAFKSSEDNPASLSSAEEVGNYLTTLLLSLKKIIKSTGEDTDTNEYYLLSMLNFHMLECEVANCDCRKTDVQDLKTQNLTDKEMKRKKWLPFAKKQIDDALQKHSKEIEMYIISASFDYYWKENYFTALTTLEKAIELKPGVILKLTIYYIQRVIEEAAMSRSLLYFEEEINSRKQLNANHMNKMMKVYNQFVKLMDVCASKSAEFWNVLLSDAPDTRKINAIGNQIFEHIKELRSTYIKFTDLNSVNIEVLYKYAIFLRFIMFDEITSNKIFTRIHSLEQDNELDNSTRYKSLMMKMDNAVIIKVSGNKNSLGKIIDINYEVTAKLKYTREELIGKTTIKELMPSIISRYHDDWILKAYDTMKFNTLNKMRNGFICDRNGFCVYVNYLIKIIPNLKEGLNFISAVNLDNELTGLVNVLDDKTNTKKRRYVFLCNENGNVAAINESAGNWLGILATDITNNYEVTIQSLIPELGDKEKEGAFKPSEGFICRINFSRISQGLTEKDRATDEDTDDQLNTVEVRIHVIIIKYGEMTETQCQLKIVIIVPTDYSNLDTKHSIQKSFI